MPLDPNRLSRGYMRPAPKRAATEKPFRPWHDLRHTALTHEAAAGNPQVYVQLKAGHARGRSPSGTSTRPGAFPGAAQRSEAHLFGSEGQRAP